MRFTRSECPDCTKEVLMTHVREEKRRLADSTSVESLVIRLFRLASAAPPPGSGRGGQSPESSGRVRVAPPVAVTVVSRSVSGQTRHDHNKRTLDMV